LISIVCLEQDVNFSIILGSVKWKYIQELFALQEKEGLKAGNKLSRRHIEWEKNKMKVCLATQTLSESVATAIDFAREDLKLHQFQGSEATTEFIRLFNSLFDILNSQNRLGKGYKVPISQNTQNIWQPLFAEAEIYIRQLRRTDGTLILQSKIKTGV